MSPSGAEMMPSPFWSTRVTSTAYASKRRCWRFLSQGANDARRTYTSRKISFASPLGMERGQAQVDRAHVGLRVGGVSGRAGEARLLSVDREGVSRDVVAGAHPGEERGVAGQDGAEVGVPVGTRDGVDRRHGDVVNHP